MATSHNEGFTQEEEQFPESQSATRAPSNRDKAAWGNFVNNRLKASNHGVAPEEHHFSDEDAYNNSPIDNIQSASPSTPNRFMPQPPSGTGFGAARRRFITESSEPQTDDNHTMEGLWKADSGPLGINLAGRGPNGRFRAPFGTKRSPNSEGREQDAPSPEINEKVETQPPENQEACNEDDEEEDSWEDTFDGKHWPITISQN